MLLKLDYDILVLFRVKDSVDVGSIDGHVLQRLVDRKDLIYEDILGPNPNPEKMINGKIHRQIPVGQKLALSEEGRYALTEYEEHAAEKEFTKRNIKNANIRASIALITSIVGVLASILISVFVKK